MADDFERELLALRPFLLALARKMTKNKDRADDLAQETLCKVWAARHRFIPGTNLKAWVFTIMRNEHYSIIRRNNSHCECSLDDWDSAISGGQFEAVELQQTIQKMQHLSREMQDALICAARGDTHLEASGSIPIGTAKSRRARAQKRLEQLCSGDRRA
jgi:RNA polymerase sigma-70 factor (ECF subfamily)